MLQKEMEPEVISLLSFHLVIKFRSNQFFKKINEIATDILFRKGAQFLVWVTWLLKSQLAVSATKTCGNAIVLDLLLKYVCIS